MITGTLEHSRFNSAMDAIREALLGAGKDVSTLLVDEQKRLTNMIVNFVPPPKHLGSPQSIGEAAVKRDLYSLISEADEKTLSPIIDKYGTRNIDTYRTSKSGDKLHLQWDNIAIGSPQLAGLHNAYRNSRGTVDRRKEVPGTWKSRVVVVKGLRDEYVATVQAHVGRMKAKVAYCASLLGARFPAYISRHFSAVSSEAVAEIQLTEQNPGITFGGRGRGFEQTRHAFQGAASIRAKQIAKRVAILIKLQNQDLAQGNLPRTHAAETGTEAEESTE